MPTRKDDCAKAVPKQVHSCKSHGVDGLETQQNGFAKGNQSAVRLMFQKANAQELQMSLNVLFKTQELQRAVCSVPPCALRLRTKKWYFHAAQIDHQVEESVGRVIEPAC